MSKFYNDKAVAIYAQNKEVGWWEGENNCCIYQKLQLVSTEIAEATEGARKDLMDDHLPHRKMIEVELADALIRVLDIGGRLDLVHSTLDPETRNEVVGRTDSMPTIGGKLFMINCLIFSLGLCIADGDEDVNEAYSVLIELIVYVSHDLGCDVFTAMDEKLEYNKHRSDHKKENRTNDGGKKF